LQQKRKQIAHRFVDLCEELEALEKRVMVQRFSHPTSQVGRR
jgi:hypothetical protein